MAKYVYKRYNVDFRDELYVGNMILENTGYVYDYVTPSDTANYLIPEVEGTKITLHKRSLPLGRQYTGMFVIRFIGNNPQSDKYRVYSDSADMYPIEDEIKKGGTFGMCSGSIRYSGNPPHPTLGWLSQPFMEILRLDSPIVTIILDTIYSRGTYVNEITAEEGTYPANGKHTDGYWYVKDRVATIARINDNGTIKNISEAYYNDNGTIKKIAKIVYNDNGNIKTLN